MELIIFLGILLLVLLVVFSSSGPGTSKEDRSVNYRALNDMFDISRSGRNAFSYELGVQMVEIYNEQVRNLLSKDIAQKILKYYGIARGRRAPLFIDSVTHMVLPCVHLLHTFLGQL